MIINKNVSEYIINVCEYNAFNFVNLTFVCPCIANMVENDDQQDATIFGLFIYS